MQSVLIRLPEHFQDPAEWVSMNAAGQVQGNSRKGSLADAAQALANNPVIVLAPTQTLLINQTIMPEGSKGKLRQAIPFAMEDKVAQDIEELHFALGKESKVVGEEFTQLLQPVAVVSKSKLEDWREQLKAINVSPSSIIPDALTLPLHKSAWSVMVDNNIALVRTGHYSGFACDIENLSTLLNSLVHKATEKPRSLYIRAYQDLPENFKIENSFIVNNEETEQVSGAEKSSESLAAVHAGINADADDGRIAIYFESPNTELLSVLANGYKNSPHINLLQGQYKTQEQYGSMIKKWRITAILFASWIAILAVTSGFEFYQLHKKNNEMDTQIKQIFKETLPNGRDNYNLREQMEQQLAILETSGTGEGGGFIFMLKVASEKIQKTGGMKIHAISYNKDQMDIDLTLSDLQLLDQLKIAFDQEQTIKADIQSASTEGADVKGRLRLTRR